MGGQVVLSHGGWASGLHVLVVHLSVAGRLLARLRLDCCWASWSSVVVIRVG